MDNKEIITYHAQEQYNEYEAEYRYLCHQKAQPEEYRVIEMDEEQMDERIAFLVRCREAYQEHLKNLTNATPNPEN